MIRSAAALTSTGLVRKHNEDCAAVDGNIIKEGVLNTFVIGNDAHVLLVADGMGGHTKGEVASTLAVDRLTILAPQMTDSASCIDAVRAVNNQLYEAMDKDEVLRGMGTTIDRVSPVSERVPA